MVMGFVMKIKKITKTLAERRVYSLTQALLYRLYIFYHNGVPVLSQLVYTQSIYT